MWKMTTGKFDWDAVDEVLARMADREDVKYRAHQRNKDGNPPFDPTDAEIDEAIETGFIVSNN